MQYLIGLDIGTSSVKGVLLTVDGKIAATAREGFVYTSLDNGGLEISGADYLKVCYAAIKKLAAAADGEILGLCASSASGNLVVLDKDGKPSTPIFNWQDTRVQDEAHNVLGEMDTDALYRRTGWGFDYKTFPLALLCYVKVHSPEVLANCGMVCMSTEYLYYSLTGKFGISTSAGTPFYLIDQQAGTYIPEFLAAFGIDDGKVPPVMPCGTVVGGIFSEAAEACGLPVGTPVVVGSFDHPSAARGVGVLEEGEMLLSCGTSWVGLFPVKSRDVIADAHFLIDPFLSPNGCHAAMVSVASVSEKIKLYVNRYIDDSDNAFVILSKLAAECEAGAGGLSICPTDEPDDEKITFYSKKQIARAIMEGTVALLKAKLDKVAEVGIRPKSAVMVGGPSEDPMWCRLIEEMCGISVRVIHGAHAGAVGAAILAGIGAGVYKDEADAKNCILAE
ncbi:MAG: hypothetical protein IJA85_04680 [Clostridia bacterium]|nr:hypothetical protein [Clostridia bacterium]